jgi:hypothetical protein
MRLFARATVLKQSPTSLIPAGQSWNGSERKEAASDLAVLKLTAAGMFRVSKKKIPVKRRRMKKWKTRIPTSLLPKARYDPRKILPASTIRLATNKRRTHPSSWD